MNTGHICTAALLALALNACSPSQQPGAPANQATDDSAGAPLADELAAADSDAVSTQAAPGSLEWAVAGDWRDADQRARDASRHPVETLEFFEVDPGDKLVEMWPGSGWYTQILAPYLAAGGGTMVAAGWDSDAFEGERAEAIAERNLEFREAFGDRDLYGEIEFSAFSDRSSALTAPGSADAVLTFRNLHNWMSGGYFDKFFDDAFKALKPGGILGIVEHRLPSILEQDPTASSGYIHADFVRAAAERAGFEFVASSEINANPSDSADHPFGVWTLPPVSRTQDRDGNTPDGFDAATYEAIGESDRMTLKFRKPASDDAG